MAAETSRNGLPYGLIEDGAIALVDGKIAWTGDRHQLPEAFNKLPSKNLKGGLVTPALIDCHSHIIAGGNRAREFEMILEGASYADIARNGGGIISTVKATREASEEQLLNDALRFVDALIAEGVSLIEIKSGYGLDRSTELRMLEVARRIPQMRPIRVQTTFLGAHTTPPEFYGRADDYIDKVCIPTLIEAHEAGLVDCVDGFCESIAFNTEQIKRVFDVAKTLGLPVKLHAEQLSNQKGAILAAAHSAISADHLEYLDEEGVRAMALAGTVAVLLPGAFYTLQEKCLPPIALLRKHNVPIAIATDCNPGSSPLTSMLLCMNLACSLFRLTPEEALAGATRNGASALGLADTGMIAPGYRADLAVWDVSHPAELAYRMGFNPLSLRIFGGST